VCQLGYHAFVRALDRHLGAVPLGGAALDEILFAGDVVRARNRATAFALQKVPGWTHLLWLDADTFPADAMDGVRAVREMLELVGEGLVGAPYTNKSTPTRWVHDTGGGFDFGGVGLVPVRGLGFGFTLTSRSCLERVSAVSGEYVDLPGGLVCRNAFGQIIAERDGVRTLLSEDFSFCERWRDLGEVAYVYSRAGLIVHAGSKAYSYKDIGPVAAT
jgi:hypothetical protein